MLVASQEICKLKTRQVMTTTMCLGRQRGKGVSHAETTRRVCFGYFFVFRMASNVKSVLSKIRDRGKLVRFSLNDFDAEKEAVVKQKVLDSVNRSGVSACSILGAVRTLETHIIDVTGARVEILPPKQFQSSKETAKPWLQKQENNEPSLKVFVHVGAIKTRLRDEGASDRELAYFVDWFTISFSDKELCQLILKRVQESNTSIAGAQGAKEIKPAIRLRVHDIKESTGADGSVYLWPVISLIDQDAAPQKKPSASVQPAKRKRAPPKSDGNGKKSRNSNTQGKVADSQLLEKARVVEAAGQDDNEAPSPLPSPPMIKDQECFPSFAVPENIPGFDVDELSDS
jgi:hypothetical protein